MSRIVLPFSVQFFTDYYSITEVLCQYCTEILSNSLCSVTICVRLKKGKNISMDYNGPLIPNHLFLPLNQLFSNHHENLIYEFDERKTPEALFAFYCDKLECDIQSKLYDEQHCVDINHQEQNSIAKTQRVNELLSKTHSFSKMWMKFGQEKYDYDKNFLAVSNYAISHSLKTIKTKEDSAEF